MATSAALTNDRLSRLRDEVRRLDEELGPLSKHAHDVRNQLNDVIQKQERAFRLFASADEDEKRKIEQQLESLAQTRIALERELRGTTLKIAEHREERDRLWRELGPLEELEKARERKERIEKLRREHERAQVHERACDQALVQARSTTNQAFFNWRAAVDQSAVDEQLAAQELIKSRTANGGR